MNAALKFIMKTGVQFPYSMLPGVNSQKTRIAIETKK